MQHMNKALFLLALLTICFSSCKKKDQDSLLGLDVQPENDLLGVTITDTSRVYMHTVLGDTTRAYNGQYKYLGSVQDPVFGRSDASIFTNFSLPNNITSASFGSNPVLDYAELRFRFTGTYIGDTTTRLEYKVYMLEEDMRSDSTYYLTSELQHALTPIATVSTKIRSVDSVGSIVLPVSASFAQYLIQNPAYLVNNSTMLARYKGFYITTSSSNLSGAQQGALHRLDLDADQSGLFVYYHNGNTPSAKPIKFQFTFRGIDARRITNIKTNPAAGAISNFYDQITGDTAKGSLNVYMQGFNRSRVKIHIPYLKNYSDSQTVAINRAELILKVDQTTSQSNNYKCPDAIALLAVGVYKQELFVKDQYANSSVLFGGRYDATNKQYVFNISRQMQDIVDGKIKNYGFYLVTSDPAPAYILNRDDRPYRLVLGGPAHPIYKPVFKVTYVKFPHDK